MGNLTGRITEDATPNTVTGTTTNIDVDTGTAANTFISVNTGTPSAGGYGTYQITTAGLWTYTLDNTDTTVDALARSATLDDTFTIQSVDGTEQVITITITGANDAPIITSSNTFSVNEGDTDVATLTATDVDTGDTTRFNTTITGTDESFFALTEAGRLSLKQAADFETQPSYSITVTATDGTDNSATQTITITITDGNDAPVAMEDTGMTAENAEVTINVLANDVDADTDDMPSNFSLDQVTIADASAGTVKGGTAVVINNQLLFNPGTDFDYLAVSENAIVVVNYTMSDNQNAPASSMATITITGTNDYPSVSGTGTNIEKTLTEMESALSATGTLTVSDVDVTNIVTVRRTLATPTGTGASIVPTNTDYTDLLTVPSGNVLSNTQDDRTFDWTFSTGENEFNYLAQGEILILAYTITVTDSNSATNTQTVTITITGTNDAPSVSGAGDNIALPLTETNLTLSATGRTLTVEDVDTTDLVTASVDALATADVTGNLPTGVDLSGLKSMLILNPTDIISGTETRDTNLGWTFNSGYETFDYLSQGESLVIRYSVKVTDDDSSLATNTQKVTITITGTNDVPVVATTDIIGEVTEQTTPPTGNIVDTGTITFTDADFTDSHTINDNNIIASTGALGTLTTVITETGADGQGGIITWTYSVPASEVEYLVAEQEKVQTFTITLDDANGGTVDRTITVTITGTNDAPSVTGAGADIAQGLTEAAEELTATGTLTVSDVDALATPTGTGTSSFPNGTDFLSMNLLTLNPTAILDADNTTANLVWTFNTGLNAFDYLATGEVLVLEYTIKVTDDDGTLPLSDTQTVTITITGTNDVPSPIADSGTTTENASIEIDVLANDTDVDANDNSTNFSLDLVEIAFGLPTASSETRATATITADNQLLFNPGTDFNYLAVGEIATVVVNYTMSDDQGATASSTATITIVGNNDIPIAKAGDDQIVHLNTLVTLDGSSSYDPERMPLTYRWTAPAGITLNEDTATTAMPTFTAPSNLFEDTDFIFELTVNDGAQDSEPYTITVRVITANIPPTAVATASTGSLPVPERTVVTLDGSLSNDPNNIGLSYIWAAPAGIRLSNNSDMSPTFTAPSGLSANTDYEFSLTVYDGDTYSAPATVTVTSISLATGKFSIKDISVSPNPASGKIKITFDEKVDYRLLNIRGQIIKEGTLETKEKEIDISSLPSGVYFLNLRTDKGSLTKKVVFNLIFH